MDIDTDPFLSPQRLPLLPQPSQGPDDLALPQMTITDLDNSPTSSTSAYQGLVEPSSDPIALEGQNEHVASSNARATDKSRKRGPSSPPISSIRSGQAPLLRARLAPHLSFQPPPSLDDLFGPSHTPTAIPSQPSQANQVKETLFQARDLIIKASTLTKDREEQGRILDLLGVFREYIERGTIAKTSAILATQITSLERATRQIQAKAKATIAVPKLIPTNQAISTTSTRVASLATPLAQPTSDKPSFASIAAKNSQEWTTIDTKAKQRRAQEQAKEAKEKTKEKAKSRRLILIRQSLIEDFSSIRIRDSINNAFKAKGVIMPVVALVTKARFSNNVVLTTTDSFSADYLIEKQSIWIHLCPNTTIQRDTPWYKVIIHGIPIREFDTPNGMNLIKEEIRTFNKGLIPISTPFWITSQERRQDPYQRVGSVAVAFSTELEAKRAIQNRLYIAGVSVRVQKYISVAPTLQCPNCQGYGHLPNRCRQKLACSLCAEPHNTQSHVCSLCKAKGTSCKHLVPKCSNCQGPHKAIDPCCEVRKALFNTTL
jgi:hypothetical protein